MPTEDAALARLDKLDAIEEIRALILAYAKNLDLRDMASYGALFASEVTLPWSLLTRQGRRFSH